MNTPRFSVVIAAYNAQRTIAETLDSALAQSETDFEIVVIDDGSQDDTLKILLGYAAMDDRIRVASQSNQGVSAARNLGVSKARGELVAFPRLTVVFLRKQLRSLPRCHCQPTHYYLLLLNCDCGGISELPPLRRHPASQYLP